MRTLIGLVSAAALAVQAMDGSLAAGTALAADEAAIPSPVDIMFDQPHLSALKSGEELEYIVTRKVSDAKLLGEGYTDTVRVKVTGGGDEGRKSVEVDVFTGERKRDPRTIDGMSGNPILVFFLDRAVFGYASVAGGKRAYLKNRFRIELRDSSEVTPVKLSYDGKTVDGYHVRVVPYAIDPNKGKMRGYENSTFDFYLSDKIPGHFVKFVMDLQSSGKAAPGLQETVVLKGAEVVK